LGSNPHRMAQIRYILGKVPEDTAVLAFVDSDRFSHFTPDELKLVRDIYLEISNKAWFDQERKGECASYVIHMYQRGMIDPVKLIPTVIDQNPCAHWRRPIDMMFHGRCCSVLQA
jgi:hypothetical protein